MKKHKDIAIQAAKEAGGKVTGRYGEAPPLKKTFIVASNGKIHDKMLEVLRWH